MREKLKLYKVDDGECFRLFWDHSEEGLREQLKSVFSEEDEIESITDITAEAIEKHSPDFDYPYEEYSEALNRDLGWNSCDGGFTLCEACKKYDWNQVYYCEKCGTCEDCITICSACDLCDRCCNCDDDDSDLIRE